MMSNTALAIGGLVAWHLLLSLLIFGPRVLAFLLKGRAPNTYKPDCSGEPDWAVRVARAHANSYESFPFTAGALLLALATANASITDPLAMAMLGARVAQSLIHMASTSVIAVLARFTFYFVQWALAAYWLYLLVG